MRLTFIERVLDGLAQPEDEDNVIAAWHEDPDDTRSLQEVLGMSNYEYENWTTGRKTMKEIINFRRRWEQWLKRKRKDI